MNQPTQQHAWKIGDRAVIGPEVYHRWASREGPVVGIDGANLLIKFDPGFEPARVAAAHCEPAGRESLTGTCRFCGKDIRQDRKGYWSLRRTADLQANDGRPWYCEPSTNDKRHEPTS